MSTSVIEPGSRLVGRYRLEDRVRETHGSTLWKAVDETLARPIAVRTFAEHVPHVREVVTAARAASRITDARLAQVFDADDGSDHAYVVSEWVAGDSITDLLAAGPMEPGRAAAMVAEAAEALAAAHAGDLSHLRLRPRCLIWTSNGTVKVTGLGIDAALDGIRADDPGAVDARDLARLLYAALTGHWPGDDPGPAEVGLPPAPLHDDDRPRRPHQVRAAVPHVLDAATDRALFQEPRRGRPSICTPADLAQALADVPRPAPVPAPPPPAAPAATTARPRDAPPAARRAAPPATGYPASGSSLVTKALVTVVVLLVMAAIGVGGWQVGRTIGGQPGGDASPEATGDVGEAQVLQPQGVTSYDPPPGDGDEKGELAELAIDGNADTAWETEGYNSAELGRLKDGVGLVLDMGASVDVRSVSVDLAGRPGASYSVQVSETGADGDFRTLGEVTDAGEGNPEVRGADPLRGQYVRLWFTRLPPDGDRYRVQVAEVVVRGVG